MGAGDDQIHEGSEIDSLSCTAVTGVECDYVAELDESVERADRGSVADQLLAQMTTHVATEHPEHALSPDQISELRDKIAT